MREGAWQVPVFIPPTRASTLWPDSREAASGFARLANGCGDRNKHESQRRKPLPGLGVLAIEEYELDPGRCIVVGASPADRGFAERLGMRSLTTDELSES